MDRSAHLTLHVRLRALLAAALPVDQHGHPDAAALLACDATPCVDESMLAPLIDGLGLSDLDTAAVALALWVEFDAGLAAAVSLLQGSAAHVGPNRPTLGLVASLAPQLSIAVDANTNANTDANTDARIDDTTLSPEQALAPADSAAQGHHLPLTPARAMSRLLQGTAVACGLLQPGETRQLAHAHTLQLAPALVALLAGDGLPRHPVALGRIDLAPLALPAWPLPRGWVDAVERLAASLQGSAGPSVVVLRGADRGELCALAATLAARLGRCAVELRAVDEAARLSPLALGPQAAREAVVPALLLLHALPVWYADVAPGSPCRLPELAHWRGPLIVLGASDSVFETALPLHEFDLSPPDATDRLALWRALQRGTSASAADLDAVARSRCGISVLAQAAMSMVPGQAAQAAIEQAVRSSARSLSAWAQVSIDRVPAESWVGPPEVHRELGLLLTRCVARADAAAPLGPLLRGRLSQGVKALFIGASGTGKTLGAQWLADRLARPLVRVDLAAVVSKYIGETEKNLAQLLSRAEHLDAVLLFDEADSLFGARTDVKQANDRYANMQTNYLLQRLETFHGVAVLTSNSKARFDDAFLRRLDAVIEFPLPDVAERRALWSLHLGEAPDLDPAVLNAVAALVDLPGGHIRNAVLTAALLARQRQMNGANGGVGPGLHGVPSGQGAGNSADSALPGIHADDLREALALEYRKLGQRAPDSL